MDGIGAILLRLEARLDRIERKFDTLIQALGEEDEEPDLVDLEGLTHGGNRDSLESLDSTTRPSPAAGQQFGSPLGGTAPAQTRAGLDAA